MIWAVAALERYDLQQNVILGVDVKDLNWSCGDIQTTLHLNGSGSDHSFYFPNLITATLTNNIIINLL